MARLIEQDSDTKQGIGLAALLAMISIMAGALFGKDWLFPCFLGGGLALAILAFNGFRNKQSYSWVYAFSALMLLTRLALPGLFPARWYYLVAWFGVSVLICGFFN